MYNELSDAVKSQLMKIYSSYQAIRDLFKKIKSPYTYNYSLSFWLYINTFHFKKITNSLQKIMTYGEKLSIMYDNIENEVVILLEDKEVYKSKGILYQRWNHIVINSHDTTIDLFINN